MAYECYRGRRVWVSGHTGFKGSWLCEWLLSLGAEVYGYSDGIPTDPALFTQLQLSKRIKMDVRGDIRDRTAVREAIGRVQPDFVFHLAAQPLVRLSYEQPVETFDVNVMGTIHVLDALRVLRKKCSAVMITTDKCYENMETTRPYRESDPMGGYDPYSCSKGCDELVISSYRRSFLNSPDSPVWIASARAGNVIGGGDWSQDRIIPDCFRALQRGDAVPIRNKRSVRPWQHVLDPLSGYLALGAALDARRGFPEVASCFNFGPEPSATHTVQEVVEEILKHVGGGWIDASEASPVHEAGLLCLDIGKAEKILGWKPTLNFTRALEMVAEWYVGVMNGADPLAVTRRQIADFQRG